MTFFQLTHVHVHVESVKENTQIWEGDQEACYKAPYLRGNPRQVVEVIEEEVPCKHSHVHGDRQAKGNSGSSSKQRRPVSMRIFKPCYQRAFEWYPYLAIGGARQYASRESSAIVCNYAQRKARNPRVHTQRREEVQDQSARQFINRKA